MSTVVTAADRVPSAAQGDATPATSFRASLLKEVISGCYAVQPHRWDALRFPRGNRSVWVKVRERLVDAITRFAADRYFIRGRPDEAARYAARLHDVLRADSRYEETYGLLSDPISRDLLIKLLAYRILGGKRVALPRNNPDYWKTVDSLKEIPRSRDPRAQSGWSLHLFDLQPIGYPIRLIAHELNLLCTFLLQQYRYERNGEVVEIAPGDVVVDAGGGWGDTALYAAQRAGKTGRVFCFEFAPENVRMLRENLKLNPELGPRVEIIEEAVWERSGETLHVRGEGPSTRLAGSAGGPGIRTRAIDDLVSDWGLERVDFIKMDVEGAEMSALRGAERTIRAHRPKLAISVYHKPEDLYEIPHYLASLGGTYRYHLDHFTIHSEETVLYGTPTG